MAGPWEQYKSSSVTTEPAPSVGPWSEYTKANEDVQAAKAVSTFDYIANQAKLGLTDTAVLGEAILDTFLVQPVKGLVTGTGEQGGIGERFSRNVQRLQKTAANITGAETGVKPPSTFAEITGGGARMLSDPIGYVGGGIVKAGRPLLDTATAVTGRVASLFGLGATAETGGIVGEQVEKTVTGENTGTGRAIGSFGAAVAGIPSAAFIEQTISGTSSIARQFYDKYKFVKTDPAAANEAYASGAAKRLLEKIAQQQPGTKLDDIVTDFNRISNIINKEDVPLMVAMSDNPAVRNQVQRLAKENPAFRQRVNTELENLAGAIDNRASLLFGERYVPVTGAEGINIKPLYARRQAIDDQIENLSQKFIPTEKQTEIGKAIENLVEARRKTAADEIRPTYQNIIKEATDAKAELPSDQVASIYKFVEENNLRDIFGRNTPIDRQILSKLSPTQEKSVNELGKEVVKDVYKPLAFENVDSLKRAINEFQRERLTLDESRRINQLETFVNDARKNIPGDFSQRLADVDRVFYEKVGIPFSAQGIKDIDSKRYAEQVAPVIIKNSSSLNQFLGAVGDQGIPIANNAVIADVYSKVIKNDVLDRKALQNYIRQKEAVLDQLPEIKSLLKQSVIDDSALKIARANIDDAVKVSEKRVADNFVLSVKDSKGVAIPNYTEVTDRLFRDPNFYAKITNDLKDLGPATSTAVRNAIRAEIVNKARELPGGGLKFLSDPKNSKVINQMFGKGYQSAVKDLVKLSDAVNTANVDDLSAVITRSELDALAKIVPGLDIPFVTSTFRDRIASLPQKAVRLATRINTAQLKTETDKAISDLLLDPQGLQKLQNTARTLDFKINNPASFKKFQDSLFSIIPRYGYGGAKEAIIQATEPTAVSAEPVIEFGDFEQ